MIRRCAVIGLAWILCALAGCASPTQGGRTPIVVASGDSTQQRLLGALTTLALEADGYAVTARDGLGDSVRLRAALLAGSVDIVWDYTDIVWSERLGHDQPVIDSQQLYMKLREEDRRYGVEWLSPTPFRGQVGLAAQADLAKQQGLRTIDDLARFARSQDANIILCTTQALSEAVGGLVGLRQVYMLNLAPWRIRILPAEKLQEALRQDECQVALAADAYSMAVDPAYMVLRDNRAFFHASDLAVAVRSPVLMQHMALEKRLRELSGVLTQEALVAMEHQVARGQSPSRVARRFLNDVGLIGGNRPTPTPRPTPTATPSL